MTNGHDAPAAVTMRSPALEAQTQSLLTTAGQRAIRAADDAALLALALALPLEVVVTDARDDPRRTRTLTRDLLALRPGCRVVIVHREEDHEGMWATILAGGHPCVDQVDAIWASLGGGATHEIHSPREVAMASLVTGLTGSRSDACFLLSTLEKPIVIDEATETLVDCTAAALQSLRAHTLYPVPIELLSMRLGPVDGSDRHAYVLWSSTLQYAANRAAGLDLPILESELELHHRPRLWAAYRVAEIVVTFVAQRQGIAPMQLLDDLPAAL